MEISLIAFHVSASSSSKVPYKYEPEAGMRRINYVAETLKFSANYVAGSDNVANSRIYVVLKKNECSIKVPQDARAGSSSPAVQ